MSDHIEYDPSYTIVHHNYVNYQEVIIIHVLCINKLILLINVFPDCYVQKFGNFSLVETKRSYKSNYVVYNFIFFMQKCNFNITNTVSDNHASANVAFFAPV